MSEQEKQESQKTVVAFVAGLIIGVLLVWVFGGDNKAADDAEIIEAETTEISLEETSNDTTTVAADTNTGAPSAQTGPASISVADQAAGDTVAITGAVYPNDEGWMGVRDSNNGQLSGLLGVARFSKEQGLIPTEIELQRATESGKEYAVVYYSDNGNRVFDLADDVQLNVVIEPFTAR